MFARRLLLQQSIRLYQNSTLKSNKPTVKFANSRISRTLKARRTHEANAKTEVAAPSTHFEPFPYAITEDNKAEVIRRVISPLHDVPYEEQLSSKESYCRNALRSLAQELFKDGTPVRIDVRRLPCHVKPIVPSPNLTRYRNKDEFSIWRGHDGSTITAGFMAFPVGKHGDTVCVEPNACETISEETIKLSDLIQIFLREKAQLPVCFELGTAGGWRRFVVRVNTNRELMLIGVLNPRGLRVQQVLDERDNFKDFMVKNCQDNNLKLASLYYQPCPHNNCKHRDVPYELLYGEAQIQETIGDKKYLISPESYIQDNVKASEVFHQTLRDTIDECYSFKEKNVKPLIIDAHCGAGVLALTLADMASHVIGVDISDQAIRDARNNARINKIDNVEFICAGLEIVLERILEKYSNLKKDILVVCDSPNVGLRRNVIETLRDCGDVNKILFITPNIAGPRVLDNLLALCRRGKSRSLPPFAPILAAPVDTSPHIERFQTILALERIPK